MFSKAEAKHIFLCYFYNRLSFFRCKKAKGAQEPKAQTTEAYPGFHEYASKYRRVPPPPPPPAVCRRYPFIHLGEERPNGVNYVTGVT